MIITPFKNREVDYDAPVWLHRNLHKKCYTVKQNGVVVGHTTLALLIDCEFIVNKKGQERVRKNKKKEVHAFVKGRVPQETHEINDLSTITPSRVRYNPYLNDGFVDERDIVLQTAEIVILGENGVNAYNVKGVE